MKIYILSRVYFAVNIDSHIILDRVNASIGTFKLFVLNKLELLSFLKSQFLKFINAYLVNLLNTFWLQKTIHVQRFKIENSKRILYVLQTDYIIDHQKI